MKKKDIEAGKEYLCVIKNVRIAVIVNEIINNVNTNKSITNKHGRITVYKVTNLRTKEKLEIKTSAVFIRKLNNFSRRIYLDY